MGPEDMAVALDGEPEIAAEIGILVSVFALIELGIPVLLSKIVGTNYDDADTILGHFRTVSNRLDLVDAICAPREGDPQITRARSLIKRARECTKIRNRYAHSFYFFGPSGNYTVSWASDATRNTQIQNISLASARSDVSKLRLLLYDLQKFCGGQFPATVLPPEYYKSLQP